MEMLQMCSNFKTLLLKIVQQFQIRVTIMEIDIVINQKLQNNQLLSGILSDHGGTARNINSYAHMQRTRMAHAQTSKLHG